MKIFLSTPSVRRATAEREANLPFVVISIHALREEGDRVDVRLVVGHQHFYPRPP